MALIRRNHHCRTCGLDRTSRLSPVGIVLWILTGFLLVFSLFFWPLIFIWPVLAIIMLLYPVGKVCQECGGPLEHRGT